MRGHHGTQVLEHRLQGETAAPGAAPCTTRGGSVGQHGRPREGHRGDGARPSTEARGREAACSSGKRRALTRPRERPGPARRWDRPHAPALPRRPHRSAKLTGKVQFSGWNPRHPPHSAGRAGDPSPALSGPGPPGPPAPALARRAGGSSPTPSRSG